MSPGKFYKITPENTHFCAFWKQVLVYCFYETYSPVRQKTELLLSEAHKINLYACLYVISFRHVPLIEDACWSLWDQISRQTKFFFWCSLLSVLSNLTATCQPILSVKEWNHKMKIKQRKFTVVIKNLRSAYISDQKTKSVYFKLRPLPSLSYATAEYCLYIFIFLGSEGRPWHSSPPSVR